MYDKQKQEQIMNYVDNLRAEGILRRARHYVRIDLEPRSRNRPIYDSKNDNDSWMDALMILTKLIKEVEKNV